MRSSQPLVRPQWYSQAFWFWLLLFISSSLSWTWTNWCWIFVWLDNYVEFWSGVVFVNRICFERDIKRDIVLGPRQPFLWRVILNLELIQLTLYWVYMGLIPCWLLFCFTDWWPFVWSGCVACMSMVEIELPLVLCYVSENLNSQISWPPCLIIWWLSLVELSRKPLFASISFTVWKWELMELYWWKILYILSAKFVHVWVKLSVVPIVSVR